MQKATESLHDSRNGKLLSLPLLPVESIAFISILKNRHSFPHTCVTVRRDKMACSGTKMDRIVISTLGITNAINEAVQSVQLLLTY